MASELFPMMLTENVTPLDTWVGVTVGFVFGLVTLNGLENLIEYFLQSPDNEEVGDLVVNMELESGKGGNPIYNTFGSTNNGSGHTSGKYSTKSISTMSQIISKYNQSNSNLDGMVSSDDLPTDMEEFSGSYQKSYIPATGEDWDDEPVLEASRAIAQPEHRSHIHTHIREVLELIHDMDAKCHKLVDSPGGTKLMPFKANEITASSSNSVHSTPTGFKAISTDSSNEPGASVNNGTVASASKSKHLTYQEMEQLAEEIDEATHNLQYKLDHCRRLLQGSETELASGYKSATWVTQDKKDAIKKRLKLLKLCAEHLIEHLQVS